jgi:trk system potassium uptake protein TrkA
MRIVFIGAGELSVETARLLIKRGHEVVIIESDKEKIETLADDLDCGFLRGDGSKPPILREAAPKQTDVLFCLSDVDQNNIIASLVGRSLGFGRVVTRIEDHDFEAICSEFGLHDIINPSRTISRYLADIVKGIDILELSTIIKDEARFFSFIADKNQAGPVEDLALPQSARVVCYYRDETFHLVNGDYSLQPRDEVVILTHSDNLATLRERFLREEEHNDEGGHDTREAARY